LRRETAKKEYTTSFGQKGMQRMILDPFCGTGYMLSVEKGGGRRKLGIHLRKFSK
jgi:hypothetical protein